MKLNSFLKGIAEGFIPVCVTLPAGSGVQKGECSLNVLLQPSLGGKMLMNINIHLYAALFLCSLCAKIL